ncbi:O-antigen ligase family protein [Candidatus Desantisbacteria bacterium]|nr:O-antigen ligase family protein [Candidatus Desantisbacteria bacterium]
MEPIQILIGSIVICSLGFAIIKPYISIIVFIIASCSISPDIFGASKIELVPFCGEQLSWVIVLIIIFCWITNALKQRDFRVIIGVQGWLLFAFWIIILISSVFAVDNSVCLEHLRGIAIVFFIYFGILNIVKTKEQLISILWTLVIVFGLSALEANIKYFQHGITPAVDPVYRDNNYFAHLLVMIIPFVFYLTFISRSLFLNVLLFILFFAMIMSCILTFSRGGFLGLIGIMAFIILKSQKKLLLLIIIGMFATVAIFFMPSQYNERIKSILSYEQDSTAMQRVYAWQAGYKMFLSNPLTGVGVGNFKDLSIQYNPKMPDKITAHNSFVQVVAECGLPGIIIFLALFITTGRELLRLRQFAQKSHKHLWLLPIVNMIEVSICGYIIGYSFSSGTYLWLLYILMGLTAVLSQITTQKEVTD